MIFQRGATMIRISLKGNNVQFILSDNPKEKFIEAKYLENALTRKKLLSGIDYSVRRSFEDVYTVDASKFDSVEDITKLFKESRIDTTGKQKDISFFKGPEVPYELTPFTAQKIQDKISELHNNNSNIAGTK